VRVLHVIPSVAPRYGGPSEAVLGMCRALERAGVPTLIATTDADGAGRLPVELGRTTDYAGARVVFFPRQWSEAFKYSRPLARWLDTHAADFDAVHVHAVFSHACFAAAAACRRAGVPYVVRPLGTLDPWSLRQKPLRKRLLWRLGARRMLERAAAVHYTTDEERRLAEGPLGLARGVVIPLGVADAAPAPAAGRAALRARWPELDAAPYVLALSRLHPKKGLEILLEAFLDTARRPPLDGWRLVVAGDGDPSYVASLRERVARRAGTELVVFAGWIDGEEKLAVLAAASLVALPSRQENFGLSVAEGLALGVPALVSPHVNLAGVITAAGAGWVAPLERAALAATLAAALGDGAERARRGARGRALARARFTWDAVAEQLRGLYSSTLDAPPARPGGGP